MRTELAYPRMRRRVMLVAAAPLPARLRWRPRSVPPKACSISCSAASRNSSAAGPAAGEFLRRSVRHQPASRSRRRRRASRGSGPAFCVRSCDGKYFPLTCAATPRRCRRARPSVRRAHQGVLRQQYRRRVVEQWRALCRQRKRLRLSQGAARRLHLQRPRARRPGAGRSHARHLAALRRRRSPPPTGWWPIPASGSAPTRPPNSRRSRPIPASPPRSAPGSAK